MADIRDPDVDETVVDAPGASSAASSAARLVESEPVTGGAVITALRPPDRRRRSWRRNVLPPAIVGVALVGFWYFFSYVVLAPRRRFMLEPPHLVVTDGFLTWDTFSDILQGLRVSGTVAIIGLTVAILVGTVIAVSMSQALSIERAVFPFMVMLQAIPILAIIPLISFWFGTGRMSRTLVCILISLFPIIVNTLFGLQSAERGMHELFTLQHVGRLTRLRKLMFPAALPAIFAGLRISAGLSIIGAVVGDFYFGRGQPGLGQLMKRYANQLDGAELLATVIVTCLMGVAVFLFFGWLLRIVTGKWHESGVDD